MICIQKIYGFHGINRQNIEKSWYVTPVSDERTEEEESGNRAVFCWTRNCKKDLGQLLTSPLPQVEAHVGGKASLHCWVSRDSDFGTVTQSHGTSVNTLLCYFLFSVCWLLEYSTRWQPSIWGDRLLRLGLRLSPNLFWNIVFVYLGCRKKGKDNFFFPSRAYI